ncbi:MAG TPA: DUF2339 domain-containing protein [Rhizomicrobium sp.]|nr:DUF2339 domain-containing protein [Rhizomicrobium sp.]
MDPFLVEKTLESLNNRISRIEAALNIQAVAEPEPVIAEPEISPEEFSRREFVQQARVPVPSYAMPGNWLGIIAVICFVLAGAFIVKLSIESGWLTPARQVGLAALLGLGLVGGGLVLQQADRAYAALLPGAGVVILYLTAFAAHRYYGLISFESAIVVVGFVSALCVWLYTQIRHDFYAFTAAAGAYLAPVVLNFHAGAEFSVYYFLLCSVAFAAISAWVRSRALTVIASYLAILLTAAIGLDLHQDRLVINALALHFVIFAAGSYFYTLHTAQPLSRSESLSFLPVLLIFYATEYHFIQRIAPDAAPWISLAFAAVLIGLYVSVKAVFRENQHSQSLILALATIVIFHAGYIELMPADARPYLFSIILLAAAFWPGGILPEQSRGAFLVPCLALIAIMVTEYVSILGRLWTENAPPPVAALLGIASIWVVLVLRNDKREAFCDQVLLGAAHLLALLAFYRLTADISSLAVSVSWLLYGASVILFAFVRKDEFMAKSALFVLAFAAGKALLVDAASAPTILRILCLLLTGAVLYGCGFLMRKFNQWSA